MTIYLPETVVIDPEVTAGTDTVIEPGVQLAGQNAHRRALQNSALEAFCRTFASTTTLPWARIRLWTRAASARRRRWARFRGCVRARTFGAGAHIGNFVEVKNTVVHEGAKAMHLTYLGDASVGRDTNIGAGTITCNYDGVAKHETKIGNRVFIGSDTALVAPVRVGDGAYVAAGSIITENVPADALAIARGRQVNKLGWAAKRRAEMKRAANGKSSKPKRRKAKSRARSKARRIVRGAIRRPRAKSRRR